MCTRHTPRHHSSTLHYSAHPRDPTWQRVPRTPLCARCARQPAFDELQAPLANIADKPTQQDTHTPTCTYTYKLSHRKNALQHPGFHSVCFQEGRRQGKGRQGLHVPVVLAPWQRATSSGVPAAVWVCDHSRPSLACSHTQLVCQAPAPPHAAAVAAAPPLSGGRGAVCAVGAVQRRAASHRQHRAGALCWHMCNEQQQYRTVSAESCWASMQPLSGKVLLAMGRRPLGQLRPWQRRRHGRLRLLLTPLLLLSIW
jgi:hypothetical protein